MLRNALLMSPPYVGIQHSCHTWTTGALQAVMLFRGAGKQFVGAQRKEAWGLIEKGLQVKSGLEKQLRFW